MIQPGAGRWQGFLSSREECDTWLQSVECRYGAIGVHIELLAGHCRDGASGPRIEKNRRRGLVAPERTSTGSRRDWPPLAARWRLDVAGSPSSLAAHGHARSHGRSHAQSCSRSRRPNNASRESLVEAPPDLLDAHFDTTTSHMFTRGQLDPGLHVFGSLPLAVSSACGHVLYLRGAAPEMTNNKCPQQSCLFKHPVILPSQRFIN